VHAEYGNAIQEEKEEERNGTGEKAANIYRYTAHTWTESATCGP
jgi:hypothetical protein